MSEKKPVSREKNAIGQKAVIEKKEKVETKATPKKRKGFWAWLFGEGEDKNEKEQ